MKIQTVCAVMLLAGTVAFAQDADRAKLYGAWQAQEQGSAGVWTIEEQGAGLHLTNSQGDRKVSEFVCDLGKECEVKDAGKKVKVTLYFNGPKLVIMETRGEEVLKRRFGIAATGDVLELENIPVSPSGKTEMIHFTRLQTTAAAATKPSTSKP